jgi:hypothetical protein
MMGLSLWQPWASLVAAGAKLEETRSWRTGYRGRLAIHAATRALELPSPAFRAAAEAVLHCQLEELPRGGIVAIATLADIHPTEGWEPAEGTRPWGDYTPGRFAWLLADVRAVSPAYRTRGHQGIWPIGDEVARLLEARARA